MPDSYNQPLLLAPGADRFGEAHPIGFGTIAFKVVPADSEGVLILENVVHRPGGPARHLHTAQDEWFFAAEGNFVVEIGAQRFALGPGDSLLAPRQVPHAWSNVGPGLGRLMIVFSPAGRMEAFFRTVTQVNAPPPQDPALWRAHGMELLGPLLAVS